MKNWLIGMAVLAGVMVAVSAAAGTITPYNVRTPNVAVGATDDHGSPCWGSAATNCELQTLVNFVSPGANINVNTDQQSAGMWSLGGALEASVVLDFRVAGDNQFTSVGLWSAAGGDSDQIARVELFNTDSRGLEISSTTPALLVFDPITGDLTINGGRGVNSRTFGGIDPTAFGFYLYDSSNRNLFYSVDALNPKGTAQVLAFQNPDTAWWTIGFEDSAGLQSDYDYQDAMIQFTPVPEPGSMLLLGTGLAGLVGAFRRRKRT